MNKLFITTMIFFSINSFAKTCPDVSGLFKSGDEYPCLTFSQDEGHGPYKCQMYNIVTQSECEKVTFFEKEVVVNPDSNIKNYTRWIKGLRSSNFTNISYDMGSNYGFLIRPDYFPPSDGTGYCGHTIRVKAKADGTDGFFVEVFNCGAGKFTETLIRGGSNLSISQRTDISEDSMDPPVPGPWQPWTVIADMPRVSSFPANTWISDYWGGNLSGDLKLSFLPAWNDWLIGNVYRFFSKEWSNLHDEEIKKTLSLLDKNKEYRCSIKAMATFPVSIDFPHTLLVESLDNCTAL